MASPQPSQPTQDQLSQMEVEANKFAEALAASFATPEEKPADGAKPAPEAGTNHGPSDAPNAERPREMPVDVPLELQYPQTKMPVDVPQPAPKSPGDRPVPPPKPVFSVGPMEGTKPEPRAEPIPEPKAEPIPSPVPHPAMVPAPAPVAAPRADPSASPVPGARADPDTRPVIQTRADLSAEPIHDLVKVAAEVALIEEIKEVLGTPPHNGAVHDQEPTHGAREEEPCTHHHPHHHDHPRSGFLRFLYAPHGDQADSIISAVEVSTNLKREKIVYAVGATLAALLIFASFAQLLCNLIGFAYPAYVSVKAIRSPSKDDDTKWLKYWTVFGFSCVVDFFADSIMHFFPLFYLAKALFLTYLYLPQTGGAEYLYATYVDPAVTRFDAWFAARYEAIKEE